MQAIDWTPIISLIYWVVVVYIAYAIYLQLDKLGLTRSARQAYWLIRQRIWEKRQSEE